MKIINIFLILMVSSLIFISCDKKEATSDKDNFKEEKTISKDEIGESDEIKDVRKAKIEISGMTCEIGCAKLIQSKLYKTNGISFAQVSFEDSLGIVDFDANILTEQDIKLVVESAGGGDLYAVKEISLIEDDLEAESMP